jgi:hypothetical protein
MTGIVHEHNLLTGYRFVVVEYLAVSLGLGALGAYYVSVADWLDAAVWLGIVVNCLVIAGLSVAALRRGAHDFGSLPMRRRGFRQWVGREHPHLAWRTLALVTVTFVPFVLAVLVAAEAGRSGSHDRHPARRDVTLTGSRHGT